MKRILKWKKKKDNEESKWLANSYLHILNTSKYSNIMIYIDLKIYVSMKFKFTYHVNNFYENYL